MRIREDGKHAHRTDTIEQAAKFWNCNKTTALMKSAEFAWRMDSRIQDVLSREDLSTKQKREIAATLSVPGTYEIEIEETATVER
jgi:hypothetical protein